MQGYFLLNLVVWGSVGGRRLKLNRIRTVCLILSKFIRNFLFVYGSVMDYVLFENIPLIICFLLYVFILRSKI